MSTKSDFLKELMHFVYMDEFSDDFELITDDVIDMDDMGKDQRAIILRYADNTYWALDYWKPHHLGAESSLTDEHLERNNRYFQVYPSQKIVTTYVDDPEKVTKIDHWEPLDEDYNRNETVTLTDGSVVYQKLSIHKGGHGIIITGDSLVPGERAVLGAFLIDPMCVCVRKDNNVK